MWLQPAQNLSKMKRKLRIESGRILKIGIPITIAQLLNISMSFVDTVMTGNYSAEALAAVSASYQSMITPLLFGAAVVGAGQAIVAQFMGSGAEKPMVGKVTLHCIVLGTTYSLLLILYTKAIPLFLPFFGFNAAVIALAGDYLSAFAWSLPATLIFISFAGFYAGISKPIMTMLTSIIMLVVNVVGNYTLIFGNFGFPELGAEGAGWTSSLAAWSGAVVIVLFSILHREIRPFNPLKSMFKLDRDITCQILRIGIPSGFSNIFEVSMFAVFTLLMGRFGVTVLAGSQIALNCAAITFMIPLGLSFAITTNVGNYLGQLNYRDARIAGYSGYLVTVLCNSCSALILILFSRQIADIYTDNAEVAAIAAGLLIFAGIFQLSDGIQVAGMGILRGYKDTKIPMFSNLISYWGVGMTLGYLLGFVYGFQAKGMWVGIIIGLTTAAILHAVRFRIISKAHEQ